ncbi:MAG: lactonase family protein [Acidobacteriota bacterium]|nr:lactonase family protein [Acidobacteriota bacterium]
MNNRRGFLGAGLAAAARMARGDEGVPTIAYVGCYTTAQRHARGDGIHIYKVDVKAGAWTHVRRVGDLVNPSFLVLGRDRRLLYSVHGDERYASAFSIYRPTGDLTLLGTADTGGANGVHFAQSPDCRFMVVANYGSGSVAVLPVRPDGRLVNQIQLVELEGQPGPHRLEQSSSHPHQVVFDPSGQFVLVPDKGLDRVFVFQFDPSTGRLTPGAQGSVAVRSGSGPRHLAFHPRLPVVWVLNELSSTVSTYGWDAGKGALKALQTVPSLPADFTGESTAAEIVVSNDGKFIYCSNRGHDSIALFQTDARKGTLTPVEWTPSGGKSPRFITFDPGRRFLHAANEQDDNIVTFRVDGTSGRLTPSGQPVTNASPVTVAFLKGE